MKDVNDALEHACRLHTRDTVYRYLMCNTHGRLDGYEKATRHRELCTFYVALRLGISEDDVDVTSPEYKSVHAATQMLTDYMDDAIGFPLYDQAPDYDKLAPLFFKHFHSLAMWEY